MASSSESLKDSVRFIPPSSEEEKREMLDFVNEHFVPLEPLNKAINICEPGYRMAWFDNFVGDYISEGFSLMAIDSTNGQLVGVSIFTRCSKNKKDPEKSSEKKPGRWEVCPKKFGQILDFLGRLADSAGDVYSAFDVEEYLEMFILCTHSNRSYPGLGSLMAEESLDRAKRDWGFKLVVTEATNFYSQKIFSRLGFELLKEANFDEYRDPQTGDIVFPKYGPHSKVQLLAKRL